MSPSRENHQHSLLRIFVRDSDRYHRKYVYTYVVEQARTSGISGCTVFRGFEGFGKRGVLTEIAMEGAGPRPVIIEIADAAKRITNFWTKVLPGVTQGFATLEPITIIRYSSKDKRAMTPREEESSMNQHQFVGDQILLRIFFGEADKAGHTPLHMELLKIARKMGLSGCTVLRGVSGFGASSIVHENHFFRLSSDLPIILEIVERQELTDQFLKRVEPLLTGTLVTEERVRVLKYAEKR